MNPKKVNYVIDALCFSLKWEERRKDQCIIMYI